MFKKSLLAVMTLVSLLAFSACKSNVNETSTGNDTPSVNVDRMSSADAEKMVKDAFSKSAEHESQSFDGSVKVELIGGSMPLKAELTLKGSADVKDPLLPKIDMKIGAKVDLDAENNMSGDLDLRVVDNMAYFYVSNLSGLDTMVPAEMASMFTNQWWSIAIPEEYNNAADLSSEDTEAVKVLVKESSFFTNVRDISVDKSVHHFTADLDKEGVKNFVVAYSEMSEQPISEEDMEALSGVLLLTNAKVDLWVDPKSGEMTRVAIDASMTVPAEERSEGDPSEIKLFVDTTYSDINKEVVVEVPADAVAL